MNTKIQSRLNLKTICFLFFLILVIVVHPPNTVIAAETKNAELNSPQASIDQTGGIDDPIPIVENELVQYTVPGNTKVYYRFTSINNNFFEINLSWRLTQYYSSINFELTASPENNSNYSYFSYTIHKATRQTRVFGNYTGDVLIMVYNQNVFTRSFNLTITNIPTPNSYTVTTAQPIIFGSTLIESQNLVPYYLTLDLDGSKWYKVTALNPYGSTPYGDLKITVQDQFKRIAYAESELFVGEHNGTVTIECLPFFYSGTLNFTIREYTGEFHNSINTAKTATIGTNEGELPLTSSISYFSFAMDISKWYSMQFISSNMDSGYFWYSFSKADYTIPGLKWISFKSSTSWFGNYSGVIYISIAHTLFGTGAFQLIINEIDQPQRLKELVYSNELKVGDTFQWQASANGTGIFSGFFGPKPAGSENIIPKLEDGRIWTLEINGSKRVFENHDFLNPYLFYSELKSTFPLTIDNSSTFYFEPSFLMPTGFKFSNGTVKSLKESIGQPYDLFEYEGLSRDYQIQVFNDELRVTGDLTSDYHGSVYNTEDYGTILNFVVQFRYDLSSGLLIQYSFDFTSDMGSLKYDKTLITPLPPSLITSSSDTLSKDNNRDSTLSGLPYINGIWVLIAILPITRKKYNLANRK